MDELELLRTARPDPVPSDLVTARHRAALRHEVSRPFAGDGSDPEESRVEELLLGRPPTRRAPGRRRAAVAAAVVALIGVGVGAAMLGADDEMPVATEPTSTVVPAAPSGSCGPLPFDLPELDGFGAVTTGPSGDAASEATADLLVVHRAAATASVEVRWPSGGETFVARRVTDEPAAGMSWSVGGTPRALPNGRHAVSMEVHDPTLSTDPGCQTAWFLVAADTEDQARAVGSRLWALLGEPGSRFGSPEVDLVAGSTTADVPPEVPPCDAPAGVDHVDRVGGPVEAGVHATPEEALTAFIASRRVDDVDPFGLPTRRATMAEGGFVETHLPDGSIAYVHEEGLGVTVVHVAPDGSGWTVARWEATGC